MVNSRIWVFLQYLTCRTDMLSCFAAGRPGVVTGGWAVSSQHRVLVLRRRRCLRHRLRPGELPLSETTQTTLKKQNLLFSSCPFSTFSKKVPVNSGTFPAVWLLLYFLSPTPGLRGIILVLTDGHYIMWTWTFKLLMRSDLICPSHVPVMWLWNWSKKHKRHTVDDVRGPRLQTNYIL